MIVKLNNTEAEWNSIKLKGYKLTEKEMDLVLSIARSYRRVLETELEEYADADGTKYRHEYSGKRAMEIGLEMGAISSLISSIIHNDTKRKDKDSITKYIAPYEEEKE